MTEAPSLVLAVSNWATNGHLMADLVKLGLLDLDVPTLDTTYEKGVWWSQVQPRNLTTHHRPTDGSDFRNLPYRSGSWHQIAFDPPYCVDEETEILTATGWKRYDEVTVGERAYTLNHNSGLGEWQSIEDVIVLPAAPRQMLSIEGRSHSSLTTMDHRWPVIAKNGKRRFTTSACFTVDDTVPTRARRSDFPTEATHSDAFVELVAWFWTEGTLDRRRDGAHSSYGNIVQSHVVNGPLCERIRLALTSEFGPDHGHFPRSGRATDGVPRWREATDGHKAVFWFSTDLGARLLAVAPGRVPTHEFLLSLTARQVDLFVEVSLLADGTEARRGGNVRRSLAQKDRSAAEAFEFACLLAGHSTSLRLSRQQAHSDMWRVELRRSATIKPSRNRPTVVDHDGPVWCVRTGNSTWLARRRGTTYFTGNCAMGGQETSDIGDFNTRYGRHTVDTPADVQLLINEGATEVWRLLAEGGLAYVKVADYVFSGELWLGVHWTLEHLISLGFMVEDMFTLTRDVASPQPKRSTCIRCGAKIQRRKDHETWTDLKRATEPSAFCRRPHPFLPHRPDPTDNGQDHASYNASVLIVARKPRRGRRTAQYPQPIDPQLELFA